MINEFKSYSKSMGINDSYLNHYSNTISNLTPYILEERELRVTQIDVFSRLLKDRIIWLSGPVNQHMADIVQAQLLFLDSVQKSDITLYINTPGGSVMNGLGIIDVMNYIKSDVAAINTGLCASMGSVILSAACKGKRSSLINSRVMIHHVSSSTSGVIDDQRISLMESEKFNFLLMKILAQNCGKTFDEIHDSSRRDKWINSDEALQLGIIDEIIGVKEKDNITKMMEGFDEYYKKEVLK